MAGTKRGVVSKLIIGIGIAIALAFAMAMNAAFYILLFIPVTTLEWVWTAFATVDAQLRDRSTSIWVKTPLFLGLAFALLVSIVSYVILFYPVVGLEKLCMRFLDTSSDLQLQQSGTPHVDCINVNDRGRRMKGHRRIPSDQISELDLNT